MAIPPTGVAMPPTCARSFHLFSSAPQNDARPACTVQRACLRETGQTLEGSWVGPAGGSGSWDRRRDAPHGRRDPADGRRDAWCFSFGPGLETKILSECTHQHLSKISTYINIIYGNNLEFGPNIRFSIPNRRDHGQINQMHQTYLIH